MLVCEAMNPIFLMIPLALAQAGEPAKAEAANPTAATSASKPAPGGDVFGPGALGKEAKETLAAAVGEVKPVPALAVDAAGVKTSYVGRGCLTRPTKELWLRIPEKKEPAMVCRMAAINQFTANAASLLLKDPGDFPKPGKSYSASLDEFSGVTFMGEAEVHIVGIRGNTVSAEIRFKPGAGSPIKSLGGRFTFQVDVEKAPDVAARLTSAGQ